jgi:hypothetical protein
MALKPEISLAASLSVLALDYGIFQINLPTTADTKSANPHNQAIDSSRKAATWTAISVCSALALLSKDPNIFIFGAGFATVLDFHYRHANSVSPISGEVTLPPASGMQPGGIGY